MTKRPKAKGTSPEIAHLPLDAVKPYSKNPRLNDSAVDAVAESIRRFGFQQPIVVDAEMVIVVGHTRWKAARKLGLDRVPVVVAKDLTPAQAKAYRIADNKTAELSKWDVPLLSEELRAEELQGFDWTALGFEVDEFESIAGTFDVDDIEAPDLASGEQSAYRVITFCLHHSQLDLVKRAIATAKEEGSQDDTSINENKNGNAIAWVCGAYLKERAHG